MIGSVGALFDLSQQWVLNYGRSAEWYLGVLVNCVAELGQIQGMVFDIWVNVTMEATTGITILTPYLSLIFA